MEGKGEADHDGLTAVLDWLRTNACWGGAWFITCGRSPESAQTSRKERDCGAHVNRSSGSVGGGTAFGNWAE